MAQLNEARSNARAAAGSAKGTRTPKPRPEATEETGSGEGSETPAEENVVQEVPLIVVCDNPKRAGSIAHEFFAKYGPKGVLTTAQAALKAGVRGKDISWDRDSNRRHILVGDEATEFAALETREEQAAYLKSKGVQEKNLIKWGYMDAPKAEEPAATSAEEKQSETA